MIRIHGFRRSVKEAKWEVESSIQETYPALYPRLIAEFERMCEVEHEPWCPACLLQAAPLAASQCAFAKTFHLSNLAFEYFHI